MRTKPAGLPAGPLLFALILFPAPGTAATFTELATRAGIDFAYDGFLGGGAAIEDYDNDGDLDIAVAGGVFQSNRLYENLGDDGRGHPVFADVTERAGLTDVGNTKGVVFADVDNNGLSDLLFFTANWNYDVPDEFVSPVMLYRNNGDGTFTDITEAAGLALDREGQFHGSALADVDGDGWLDLYVGNRGFSPEGGYNRLLRNRGDGTFEDVTSAAGLDVTRRMTLQAGFFDYDNDGDQDIYNATDKGGTNELFRNNGDGTFTDVSIASGTDLVMDGMCVTTGDYDHDGDFEIYVSNIPEGHALLVNNGDGTFTERAEEAGAAAFRWGWGSEWLDYDNDGWLDIYSVAMGTSRTSPGNLLFRNRGDGTFADRASIAACQGASQSYGFAYGDLDMNGGLDLLVVNHQQRMTLFMNSGGGRYLKVKLIGLTSNWEGVGSRLELTTGPVIQTAEVHAGSSYLSQSQKEIHFGLGSAGSADRLDVIWPTGIRETFTGLQAGCRYRIVEGMGVQQGTLLLSSRLVTEEDRNTLEWEVVPWPGERRFLVRALDEDTGLDALPPVSIRVTGRRYRYVDTLLPARGPGTYRYRIVAASGEEQRFLWESDPLEIAAPTRPVLAQNSPNPFHLDTVIPLRVPRDMPHPSVKIFDLAGRLVGDYPLVPGSSADLEVSRRDLGGGAGVSAGIYHYRLFSGSTPASRTFRMVLLP